MKKRLLFENALSMEHEKFNVELDLPLLKKLNEFFIQHDLGRISAAAINEAVMNPQKFVYNVIKSRLPDFDKYTRLKNNKDQMLSAVEMPQINPDLLYLIKINILGKDRLQFYDFNDGVSLNADRIQACLDEKYNVYSDNEDICLAFDTFSQIADLINALNKRLKFMPIPAKGTLSAPDYFKNLEEIYFMTPSGLMIQRKGFENIVKSF